MLTSEMGAGIPADFGDWALVKIFHEGGRLLKKHLGDLLPVILLFIFPASLIKVLRSQFFMADSRGSQGSTDTEPISFWTLLFLTFLLDGVPLLLNVASVTVMFQILKNKIYVDGDKTEAHPQSFFTSVKLAFTLDKGETEFNALLLRKQLRMMWNSKFLKGFAAIVAFIFLFTAISTSGMNFTPEAIAEMGLSPRTLYMFTILITVITTLSTSYFSFTGILVVVWMVYPRTPILINVRS
ncbi:hypothetical protein M758_9G105100 [Ceratodon purpureus]|nr:hypothetical protein M758_9G105100 [Ceratodon purpureus]